MAKYTIESRWPEWARWRPVTARPHDERFPFDPRTKQLVFERHDCAAAAAQSLSAANAGEYRVSVMPHAFRKVHGAQTPLCGECSGAEADPVHVAH